MKSLAPKAPESQTRSPIIVSDTGVIARERSTIGSRLREARERANMTQADVAGNLPSPKGDGRTMSRANIAQYESDAVQPPIHTVEEIARLVKVPASYLAFGVGGLDPSITAAEAQDAFLAEVPEFMFGDGPGEREVVTEWKLPKDWLKSQLRVSNFDDLFIYQCESANMAPQYEYGDKLVVDGRDRRGSGVYLHWDGTGPAINRITVIPKASGPVARVGSTDNVTEQYEVPVSDLNILGRVRGVWKAS